MLKLAQEKLESILDFALVQSIMTVQRLMQRHQLELQSFFFFRICTHLRTLVISHDQPPLLVSHIPALSRPNSLPPHTWAHTCMCIHSQNTTVVTPSVHPTEGVTVADQLAGDDESLLWTFTKLLPLVNVDTAVTVSDMTSLHQWSHLYLI